MQRPVQRLGLLASIMYNLNAINLTTAPENQTPQLRRYTSGAPVFDGKQMRKKHFNKKRHGKMLKRKHRKSK